MGATTRLRVTGLGVLDHTYTFRTDDLDTALGRLVRRLFVGRFTPRILDRDGDTLTILPVRVGVHDRHNGIFRATIERGA